MKNILDRLKKIIKINDNFYKVAINIHNRLHNRGMHVLFYVFKIIKIKKNKIVFCNFCGNDYSDNPKYIAEEMIVRGLQYDMVWLLKKELIHDNNVPSSFRKVIYGSIKSIYEMATAQVWVDNTRKEAYVRKRRKQFYIQTWHGTALKKIENDAVQSLPNHYIKRAIRDSKNIDLLISGNKYSSDILNKSFWYNGDILEVGTPRNDIMINKDPSKALKIRKSLGLNCEKIIFYAPTFRNDKEKNGLYQIEQIKPDLLLDKFREQYSEECILMIRFHPNVANCINLNSLDINYRTNILDVSSYPDMQELLYISDVLITDYSSSFFDFALLERPVFLFIPDCNDYNKERGLYFDMNKLPLYICNTYEELIKSIKYMNSIDGKNRSQMLLEKIGDKEGGNSSKIIVEKILELT